MKIERVPKGNKKNNSKEFVLKFCDNCYQMTNHIGKICQKCKKVSS